MKRLRKAGRNLTKAISNKKGMELVQVAILVAIAVVVGIIFRTSVVDFVNGVFNALDNANF